MSKLDNWLDKHFGEHYKLGPICLYGSNAMHFATNIKTPWGYLCFRPSVYHYGRWWRWYIYLSKDGTPCKPYCK